MTVGELYEKLKNKLENDEHDSEARLIICSVLGYDFTEYLTRRNDTVSTENINKCEAIAVKRNGGTPLYYILGRCEFYGFEFFVGEGVLIPRGDTETLVDFCLKKLEGIENPRVLDLCSGSGCIAISIARICPNACVTAVELYDTAYSFLEKNINSNGVKNCTAIKADALTFTGEYDLVVSNPPYIAFTEKSSLQKEVLCEPETALFAEDNGYYYYEQIAKNFNRNKNLSLVFEVGVKMDKKVSRILSDNGFYGIETAKDFGQIVRVVSGNR